MQDESQSGIQPLTGVAEAGSRPSDDTPPEGESLSRRATDFGLAADGSPIDPVLGRELGDIVVERLLTQGGMGRIYLGRQRRPPRPVAVKVMRCGSRSAAGLRRFEREADVLGRLSHPGIAQIFTAGSLAVGGEQVPYLVMEHVAGAEPLVAACDRLGLDAQGRLRLLLEVCRAVAHGHEQGVVHRDLKPGNILVGADGRSKLIDFGIAWCAEEEAELTKTGEFLGTRHYASPEQFAGQRVDARSDVHALGMILHELLTGRLPYDLTGRSLAETARIIRDQPPARLRLPDRHLARSADAIAGRCLAKRPDDRYANAGELAADLERLLSGRPLVARPPGPFELVARWCGRHRTAAASLITAVVSALTVTVVLSRGGRPGVVPTPAGPGPRATFATISSVRTTPLQWLQLTFDEPVRDLTVADFRLTRDGEPVSLEGATVSGGRDGWEIRGLERLTARGGTYVLELAGTPTSPVDIAGRRLERPARATWRMPPYQEIAFNLLGDEWRRHVVSLTDMELYTERSAGAATFLRPTVPGREGSVVMRFPVPYPVRAATLSAFIAVWTTGDPFPYDPAARAAIDVSPDGKKWTTLEVREANRGGFGGGPHDIREQVAGAREIWVRARLTAGRAWPEDGLIHAQFLRTAPNNKDQTIFRLTVTGPDPAAVGPPAGTPAADH